MSGESNRHEGINWMHFRDFDPESGEMLSQGGATVAFTQMDGRWYAGVAFCSPEDNYNKHYGREKSAGRLEQLLSHLIITEEDTSDLWESDSHVYLPLDVYNHIVSPEGMSERSFITTVEGSMAGLFSYYLKER